MSVESRSCSPGLPDGLVKHNWSAKRYCLWSRAGLSCAYREAAFSIAKAQGGFLRCVFVVKELLTQRLYLLDMEVKENTDKAGIASS